ncbi:MAG: hypothetical protein KDD38_03575 [Bdellovibrionales bacterium]|nr:hypothetical protein [Bdellovibrionales bacterium]
MSDSLQIKTCPKCGNAATDLIDVDDKTKALFQKQAATSNLPSKVCSSCYSSLTSQVSQGVKLRIEAQAREKNRHMVWKSRVNLVRHARQMMSQKAYAEAAVSYEKYIRVLEISYDLKPGTLNPEVFGKSARSKELTIIATTYWDLLRIYDTNPKYRERMALVSRKLAEFLPFSPLFPDIIKNAQSFSHSAKNPDIVRDFLKKCKASAGKCFIATAAFEDSDHPIVMDFRNFRDSVLAHSFAGRIFINCYYRLSPPLAEFIVKFSILRHPTRTLLRWLHFILYAFRRRA